MTEQLDSREPYLSQEGWEECAKECEEVAIRRPLGRHLDVGAGWRWVQPLEIQEVVEMFFDYWWRVEIKEVRWPL